MTSPTGIEGATDGACFPWPDQPFTTMEPRHDDVHVIHVQLPDRPGALGAVTSRIGAVGGDVLAIEVVDRTEGAAVDELVVDLPAGASIDLLRRELGETDGVVVERVAVLDGPWLDPRMAALATAEALLVAADRDTVLDFLCARVVHDLRCAWAGPSRPAVDAPRGGEERPGAAGRARRSGRGAGGPRRVGIERTGTSWPSAASRASDPRSTRSWRLWPGWPTPA